MSQKQLTRYIKDKKWDKFRNFHEKYYEDLDGYFILIQKFIEKEFDLITYYKALMSGKVKRKFITDVTRKLQEFGLDLSKVNCGNFFWEGRVTDDLAILIKSHIKPKQIADNILDNVQDELCRNDHCVHYLHNLAVLTKEFGVDLNKLVAKYYDREADDDSDDDSDDY